MTTLTRRRFLRLAGSIALAGRYAHRVMAQTSARVVVDGGFGGTTCAKYIRRADPSIEVTLVAPQRQFVTCPFSNAVLAGLRDLASVTHRYESMRGVRARYPRFSSQRGKLINLEQQINRCRAKHMQIAPYVHEAEALLALTTFVGLQSRGLPVEVKIDGPAHPFFEAGKAFFFRRRGQLDLACTHCHDQYAGQRLRGDIVSQGHINDFPVYRPTWQTLGSTHRMFEWCNVSVRAKPFPYGSDAYVNLELFMAWRARGLRVETPAIRR